MTEASRKATARAEESVASRFSRTMNATTSPYGTLTDPPLIALATGILFIALLAAIRLEASPAVVRALSVLTASPLLVACFTSLALAGARSRVIAWLASLPFPLENMNAVLNGLGESLEITFAGVPPETSELNRELDRVSPDAFVTRGREDPGAPGESGSSERVPPPSNVLEVRIGVVDSKRNPAASNYLRFVRVRRIVDEVLVPLHARDPMIEVRIK